MSDDYDPLEVIGRGSFGTVRKVRHKESGQILVRKEIEYVLMNNQERNQIISELRILRELDHEHIVKYWRHDHDAPLKAIHIYMEYCDGGDLAGLIKKFRQEKERVPEQFVWQVMVQMLLALHRCHYGHDAPKVDLFTAETRRAPSINLETVIIHRDIKPDNIFLVDLNKQVKLGDFGLAKMINTTKQEFAQTYVGTPYYMSPEVLMDNPYLPVCDVWLLGCVLFELCTLQPPFLALSHLQLQNKIKAGKIPEINAAHYLVHLRQIIRDCITVDPSERPLVHDLLNNLSVQFLRKEIDLKLWQKTQLDYQKQLSIRDDDLHKREQQVLQREQHIHQQEQQMRQREQQLRQREQLLVESRGPYNDLQKQLSLMEQDLICKDALVTKVEGKYQDIVKRYNDQRQDFDDQMAAVHRKFAQRLKLLEEEVDMKRRQLDLENKELRLNYQREFRMVVEKEVNARLRELLHKQESPALHTPPIQMGSKTPQLSRPRGPQKLNDRLPLKINNEEYFGYKTPLPRPLPVRKRITPYEGGKPAHARV